MLTSVYTSFFFRFLLYVLIEKLYQTLEVVIGDIPNTSKFNKNTPLRFVFWIFITVFGFVIKRGLSYLIFSITDLGFWCFVKFDLLLKTHLMLIRKTRVMLRVSRGFVCCFTRTDMLFVLSSQLQQRWRGWLCASSCVWSFILRRGIWILAEINYASLLLQKVIQIFHQLLNPPYYLAYVFGGYNAPSDWLILQHYPPAMRTGWLQPYLNKSKSHIINNLLTSNFRSGRKNPQPRLFHIDLSIAR